MKRFVSWANDHRLNAALRSELNPPFGAAVGGFVFDGIGIAE